MSSELLCLQWHISAIRSSNVVTNGQLLVVGLGLTNLVAVRIGTDKRHPVGTYASDTGQLVVVGGAKCTKP